MLSPRYTKGADMQPAHLLPPHWPGKKVIATAHMMACLTKGDHPYMPLCTEYMNGSRSRQKAYYRRFRATINLILTSTRTPT